jgi:hypothetical protein
MTILEPPDLGKNPHYLVLLLIVLTTTSKFTLGMKENGRGSKQSLILK